MSQKPTTYRHGASPTVLVLYSELAPYVLASLQALADEYQAQVHIVRWPVNNEAPFMMNFGPGLHPYERSNLNDVALIELAASIDPDMVLCSGWIDKGYLKVCRKLRAKGAISVMCSDTAWRGDLRQWAAVVAGRIMFPKVFSHAWVTGGRQKRYARNLGFDDTHVRTGFYAADTARFLPLGKSLLAERKHNWPHRFLCVARYIGVKNHQLLCDAFAELASENKISDWELWFTGAGELFDQVFNSQTGKHARITHKGFVQADAMPEILRQCGVFILPSAYEPWGVVVQEHACAGFPLALSSEVRASERFLVEDTNGVSFIANDKDALKYAMQCMIDSSDAELAAMGEHSHQLGDTWGPSQWAHVAFQLMTHG